MFKKWFGKEEKKERKLTHPRDLLKGDMVQFIDSFALPADLKGETLTVTAVNTYQYEYEHDTEFVLKGSSARPVFLNVEEEDGEEWANISIKIQPDDVDALFGLDQFADIFDSEALSELERQSEPDEFTRWTGEFYRQTGVPVVGYFYNKDFRGKTIPQHVEDGGEPLESIELADGDERFYINIEIWHDGETDVALTICRPLTDIIELFPGS